MSLNGGTAGAVIGGVIGAVVAVASGGTGFAAIGLGISIGSTVGGIAGNLYDTYTADDALTEQQSLGDLKIQTSTFGQTIPQVFGKYGGIAGNVIWATDKEEHVQRDSQSAAGKGGGPQSVSITKTYTISLAIALCDTRITGPIAGITKIYRDLTVIADATQGQALPDNWTFYSGTATQDPDPLIESIEGVGNAPAYRYLCYVVIEDDDLGRSGRTYNYTFDLAQGEGTTPLLSTGVARLGNVAISPTTDHIWVTVSEQDLVYVVDEGTLEVLATYPITGRMPQLANYQAPIVIDAGTDDVFIASRLADTTVDPVQYRVIRLTEGGGQQDAWDFTGEPLSNMVYTDGSAWVATWGVIGTSFTGTLLRFTAGGAMVTINTDDNAFFARLCVGADGHVWKANKSGTVERIDPGSDTIIASLSGLGICSDICTGADGYIWVSSSDGSVVRRIDPGSNTVTATITVGYGPVRLTLATDGYLWTACTESTPPGTVYRINPASNTAVGYTVGGLGTFGAYEQILVAAASGSVWVLCSVSNTAVLIDTAGATLSARTGINPYDAAYGAGDYLWVTNILGGNLQRISLTGITTDFLSRSSLGLGTVITNICAAAGVPSGNLDLTLLPSGMPNLALVSMQAARAVLQTLAEGFRFYLVESGTQLAFREIGSGSVVANIPESQSFFDASGATDITGVTIVRRDDIQLPTVLDVTYVDPLQNYQRNTQRVHLGLPDDGAEAPRTLTTALALQADQARQLAQETLYNLWVQRETFTTTLARKFAFLEPGDRITLDVRDITYSCVVTETSYGAPGLVQLTARADAHFTRNALGPVPGVISPPIQIPAVVGDTTALLLNIPALTTTDQMARYHVAYIGEETTWAGATLYRSTDGEASFQQLDMGSIEAITGTVALATASADWHTLDTSTSISVVIESGTLLSVSDLALMNGQNLCLVGAEILGFGLATLTATNTYTLTRLLRGRRGTEWAVAGHGMNEPFVLLDNAARPVAMTLADRNVARPYKAVTFGQSIADVTSSSFTPTAANLVPWDVAQPTITLSGGDFILTWYMRSRFNGDWGDGAGIGFDPDFLAFHVIVYTDNTYTIAVRDTMTDGDNPMDAEALKTWTYTSAMQTTDFGAPQSTIYARIYQATNTSLSVASDLVGA